ncbi:MAG: WYL domain-containing protein [Oscillospiraceae bacterium]|nr:WYL domain-containing protein [Oscillospiraceae bacterium]
MTSSNNITKSNILALLKILMEQTDEEHSLSMSEILRKMEESGHKCSQQTIHSYIDEINRELGIEVIYSRGRYAGYSISDNDRIIRKTEMKILVDLINATNFITPQKSKELIENLKSIISIYEQDELDRTVFGVNVAKANNESILRNIDTIQDAIRQDKQISFEYLQWNENKRLVKNGDDLRVFSPWAFILANDRYYLYGYKNSNGKVEERCYRVDKLKNIRIIDAMRRDGRKEFKNFDASTYVSRRKEMFSGDEKEITVRIKKHLAGAFIDQFGIDIEIEKENEEYLIVNFIAVPSNIFLGWIIGMGDVEILSPESVRKNMRELIEKVKI